jgi:hypothetical protein
LRETATSRRYKRWSAKSGCADILFHSRAGNWLSRRRLIDRHEFFMQSSPRPRRLSWLDLTEGRLRLDRLPAMAPSDFFPPPESRLCIAMQKSWTPPSFASLRAYAHPARERAGTPGGCRSIVPRFHDRHRDRGGAVRN